MSRFCDKCGSPLKPNENFCTNCGAKIIRDESPSTPPDKPKSESKSPSTKVICIGLAVAVSVIFTVAMFVNRSISDTNVSHKPAPVEQPKTQSATVPDVIGKTQSDAVAALKAAGIEAKISDSYSADVPIGKIISQTPNPGANIARGQTVYLYVSKGVDPGKTSEPLTEADFTLGGLTLGMSKAEVKMKYGNPSNDGDDYFNYGNIEVGFANGLVKTVACTGSNATSRGIVIGASLADIERVYGKNYSRDKDSSGDIYTYKFGDSSLRFVLDERSGKITRIAVYKSTPKATQSPAQLSEADLTIAGLTLDMSRQAVEAKIGAPISQDDKFFYYGNIVIHYENNAVELVAYTGSNATPRGIRVGSSLADVEQAYGKNYSTEQRSDTTSYIYQLERAHLNFVINNAGRVERIVFYKMLY